MKKIFQINTLVFYEMFDKKACEIVPGKWRQRDLGNSKLSTFSQKKMKGLNVVCENILFCNDPSSI